MTSLLEIREDPRYKQGKKFIQERKFEDAINLYSSLLQTCNEKHGEMSVASALAYYEYGSALLFKEEEEPTDDLIGPTEKVSGNQSSLASYSAGKSTSGENCEEYKVRSDELSDIGDNHDDEDEEEDEDDEEEPVGTEQITDLVVAWEVLDLARVILEKASDPNHEELLSEVYVRLGDLMRINGNYNEAIDEYLKGLSLRQRISPDSKRIISNIYYLIAISYIYKSGEESANGGLEEKQSALKHYEFSRNILLENLLLHESKSLTEPLSDMEAGEIKELVDELTETIASLSAEIKEIEAAKGESSISSAPQTTIGFGASASKSEPVLTINASGGEVNSVQVKKKQKTTHPTNPDPSNQSNQLK